MGVCLAALSALAMTTSRPTRRRSRRLLQPILLRRRPGNPPRHRLALRAGPRPTGLRPNRPTGLTPSNIPPGRRNIASTSTTTTSRLEPSSAACSAPRSARVGKGPGAAVGGALGVGAGATVGANAAVANCPPGYVIRAGAPAFVYAGPYYDPALVYAPAWYNPWVWVGGQWVYYPYRYWYWYHPAYWGPGWVARPWRYHYRRW